VRERYKERQRKKKKKEDIKNAACWVAG